MQLSAHFGHTCVRFEGGGLKCWGLNHRGQLGIGDTSHRGGGANQMGSNLPWVNLGAGRGAKQVAVGFYYTCAIRDDDSLMCWGTNQARQLGHAGGDTCRGTSCALTPTLVDLGTGASAKQVAASYDHSCAILHDDSLKCWGDNTSGKLGTRDTTNRHTPTGINLGANVSAKKIALGDSHTCAILNDDSVVCWGDNQHGELGYGDTTNRNAPPATGINLGQGRTARQIVAGYEHTCALLDDNSLVCWGENGNGQWGWGTLPTKPVPRR